jgi:hypothetical protein
MKGQGSKAELKEVNNQNLHRQSNPGDNVREAIENFLGEQLHGSTNCLLLLSQPPLSMLAITSFSVTVLALAINSIGPIPTSTICSKLCPDCTTPDCEVSVSF